MDVKEIEAWANIFFRCMSGIAILIGGIWALTRFSLLKEAAHAKAQLKKVKAELEQQPIIDITLDARQVSPMGANGYPVEIDVALKNNGQKPARLSYEQEIPLNIYKVSEHDGAQSYALVASSKVRLAVNPNGFAKATVIRAGQSENLPFFINLPQNGTYFITFRAVLPQQDRSHLEQVGSPEYRTLSWVAKSYLHLP